MESSLSYIRRFPHPIIVPTLITLLVYGLIMVFLLMHGYSFSSFILAGDEFTSPQAPIIVSKGAGYDGQFFYRLAIDPFTNQQSAQNVTLDKPHYRQQRILYPLIVNLLAGGRIDLIPIWMIIFNLLAIGGITALGAVIMQRIGINPYISMAFVLNYGVLVSFTRDLAEITELLLIMTVFVTLPKHKRLSVMFLCLAIFAKETSLIIAVSILIIAIWQRWQSWKLFTLPLLTYAFWQSILFFQWGLTSGITNNNFGLPMIAISSFFLDLINRPGDPNQLFVMFLVTFFAISMLALAHSSAPYYIRLAWILNSAMILCFAGDIWIEPEGYMRASLDWYILGIIIVLTTRMPYMRRSHRYDRSFKSNKLQD